MAETLKPTSGEDDGDGRVTEKHNVAAREGIINDLYKKFSQLQTEIDEAVEEHVKPLKDAQSKALKQAKTDTGIPIAVFKAQFKLIQQARQAELDEDENATTIDDIREVFQALKKGGQLSFLEVVDGAGGAESNVTSIGEAAGTA